VPDEAVAPTSFVVPPTGEIWTVTGRIAAISAVPRPGAVPYRDHILSVHLVDLEGAPVPGGQAVVYTWSMRGFELTDAARWQIADRVRLRLRAWRDVAHEYDGVNRSELSDARVMLEEPCWGEPVR
jgi:alginate O-acetyltransferase complex protein AlgJ